MGDLREELRAVLGKHVDVFPTKLDPSLSGLHLEDRMALIYAKCIKGWNGGVASLTRPRGTITDGMMAAAAACGAIASALGKTHAQMEVLCAEVESRHAGRN